MEAIRHADALLAAATAARSGRVTVVKLGGSAMEDAVALRSTLQSVVALADLGLRPVLVHGGGKPIDRAMAAAGLTPRKVQGRRYTDEATLKIVVEVLTADINAGIVRQLRELGGRAIPLHSGAMQALAGERLTLPDPGGPIDLGRVGEATRVDAGLIAEFVAAGTVPVIPSLAVDESGWLNVNADTAACAVAAEMRAARLVMLTDTPGILRDAKDPATLIGRVDVAGCRKLAEDGVIDGGMIPKVEACVAAIRAGVGSVRVIDGRRPMALLLDLLDVPGIGTVIVP